MTIADPIVFDTSKNKQCSAELERECAENPKLANIIEKFKKSLKDDFNVSKEGSDIIEFFRGKCVFITGATGFLGKLLVEKLLRTCDGIDTVYVMVRDKKGKDINARVDELYSDVVCII